MEATKIIAGVLVVAVLGVGGALASKVWNPSWNPFGTSPEKVIEKMAKAQKGVDSGHITATVKAKSEKGGVELSFEADGDSSDPENSKSKMSFDGSISMEGTQLSTKGKARFIDDTMYFKISEIPAAPMLPISQIGAFKDQWIKIDTQKAKQSGQAEMDSQKAKKIVEKYLEPEKLLNVEKAYSAEQIKDVKCYHYLVALNEKEIKNSFPKMAKELQELNEDAESVDKEEMRKKIDEFFNKTAPVEAELWIGQKDYLLRKFKFSKEINAQDVAEESEISKVDLAVEAYFSDFGQKVEVEKPESAKTIQELMMSMMGSGNLPGTGSSTMPDNMPEGTNLPDSSDIPEGTDVPQLPLQDFGGPAFLLQGIF